MSDSIEDIVRNYNENVHKEEHPRSIGLFTIPEYPELVPERGMWSAALDAILTTLRYLAPATLLTIFWGQQSFLFKILKHIDSAFRSIVFSSEEQKQAVLKWLAEAGPVRVEHLDTVWRHGWILCGVLDAALPGACAGHPPTRLSMKHAQAIADHYLGVEPVFSRQELESNDSLSRHQEWKLATYLERIRQVLSKLTPPVSKPVSHRTSPETAQFILDYVAKGSGLTAVQINNKAHFKIYPTAQQSLDPGDVTILIRGPKDTYGMTVVPPILGKAQLIRQKLLGLQSKQTYTENVLPLTQGATYLRSYGKNDMNKTYFIPKAQYDIKIEVDSRKDHTKISYTVKLEGKYLVSITSRGQSIVGSPFAVTATNNIISIFERDSFCLEDGEEIDILDIHTDRKVVLRIVDFVTEKMLLKENGTLEKITEDKAKELMATDKLLENENFDKEVFIERINEIDELSKSKQNKFNKTASNVLIMNRVCKLFNNLIKEKRQKLKNEELENYIRPRSQQDIPDIVNSTFTEANINSYVMAEMREKFIIPECLSVSLRAEKSKTLYDELVTDKINDIENTFTEIGTEYGRLDTPDSLEVQRITPDAQESDVSMDTVTPTGVNNPFLNEMFETNYVSENNFGTFVTSEYETNNSQNEETRDNSITIIIDPNLTEDSASENKNPFIENHFIYLERPKSPIFKEIERPDSPVYKILERPKSPYLNIIERPKSPIFKINSGEKANRKESAFIDTMPEVLVEEELGNEFVNPFFVHQFKANSFEETPTTDFIIGAPVSLPPIIRAPSPVPAMKSIIITENESEHNDLINNENTQDYVSEVTINSVHSPPLNKSTKSQDIKREDGVSTASFHSLDSNLIEIIDNSNSSTPIDIQEPEQSDNERNITPRKDMWDSAYVSIDDNNSSPDTNNNENTCDPLNKPKDSPTDENTGLKLEEISNMGPAEREIWQNCNKLKYDTNKGPEDVKTYKWEIKRPIFTPIIEESDRSISSGTKDTSRTDVYLKQRETETVSVAFAELNDMYQEYFPNSETSSTTFADEDNMLHSMDVAFVTQTMDDSVDSASDATDVKRHEEHLEGTISEVQANVTESVSVSQPLRINKDHKYTENKVETQFGEKTFNNIVLEKKKYWDARIQEIEAKSQETTGVPKKRRVSGKQLKHDSLSKRKGKQMIKNFLSSGDYTQVTNVNQGEIESKDKQELINENILNVQSEEKLVNKWKKYWDEKVEIDDVQLYSEVVSSIAISNKSHTPSPYKTTAEEKPQELLNNSKLLSKDLVTPLNKRTPVKQELPEEVFRAFETSPKRFFGTSRQQILNKIDTFLGKPVDMATSTQKETGMSRENGLVSSRISLFHNMSSSEELPWVRRKSTSLQNISQKQASVKNISLDDTRNEEVITKTETPTYNTNATENPTINNISNNNLRSKRAKMMQSTHSNHKTIEENVYEDPVLLSNMSEDIEHIKKTTNYEHDSIQCELPKVDILRKKSFSRSEMDIFNKPPIDNNNELEKHKSYDELPKINVRSFISLYENVSKTVEKPQAQARLYRNNYADSRKRHSNSTASGAVPKRNMAVDQASQSKSEFVCTTPGVTPTNLWTSTTSESVSNLSLDTRTSGSYDVEPEPIDNKETTYLSLSDIELEIIESTPDKSIESTPEREIAPAHIEYKNRFKLAKEYFQSLEELREIKKPRKPNECEVLLRKLSNESLDMEESVDRPQKRVKKNIKSHSLPSSEIAKGWNQLQEAHAQERCASEESTSTKLVKISEKFNVDDLFTDVTEGKLSRQGSLRGIPHKKAVLETFKSMENVTDTSMNSYELSESELTDFAKEHRVVNAQTYLNEYPYLPTTDPSKYHSRVDVKAQGLISLKELKKKKPRRNSVPDMRLNPNFTVNV